MAKPVKEVEFEVLDRETASKGDSFIALVARLMDEIFVIPGTNIRFGLDPLISLLPGFGASASAGVSLVLIALCARRGVPRVVLLRMAANVLVNAVLDAVPVIGDALSVFYRSNSKNYDLLRKHAGTAKTSTRGDWIFLIALLGGMALVLFLLIIGALTVAFKLFATAGKQG